MHLSPEYLEVHSLSSSAYNTTTTNHLFVVQFLDFTCQKKAQRQRMERPGFGPTVEDKQWNGVIVPIQASKEPSRGFLPSEAFPLSSQENCFPFQIVMTSSPDHFCSEPFVFDQHDKLLGRPGKTTNHGGGGFTQVKTLCFCSCKSAIFKAMHPLESCQLSELNGFLHIYPVRSHLGTQSLPHHSETHI